MDFNLLQKYTGWIVISCTLILFVGCADKQMNNTNNTFYVEMVNFKYDSLKQALSNAISGKVSFYKNNKLEILSENYVTDDLSELYYFKNVEILGNTIKEGTRKIRIEFKGDFLIDSIKYALQKYKYSNKVWVKTSDMGDIKDMKRFEQPRYIMEEYVRKIVLNIVEYAYN